MLLTLDPSLKSPLVDREVDYARAAEQFTKYLHHFRRGRKNKFIHSFRLSLASVGIEVDPASIRTEQEHTCLGHRIAGCDARLGHQIRTAFAAGTEIQNVRVAIVISNCPH